MPLAELTRVFFIFLMFEETEPQKRSKNLCLHSKGSRVPCLAQHTIDGDCTQTRQTLTRLPVGRGDRQRPEHYARIVLWPSMMQASTEKTEVEMPKRDTEK